MFIFQDTGSRFTTETCKLVNYSVLVSFTVPCMIFLLWNGLEINEERGLRVDRDRRVRQSTREGEITSTKEV